MFQKGELVYRCTHSFRTYRIIDQVSEGACRAYSFYDGMITFQNPELLRRLYNKYQPGTRVLTIDGKITEVLYPYCASDCIYYRLIGSWTAYLEDHLSKWCK